MRPLSLLSMATLAAAVPKEAVQAMSGAEAIQAMKATEAYQVASMSLEELDEMSREFGDTTFSLDEQLEVAYSVHDKALANADPIALKRFTAFSEAASQVNLIPPTVKDIITTPVELVKFLGSTAAYYTYMAGKLGYDVAVEWDYRSSYEWTRRRPGWRCKPIIFFWARGTLEGGNMVC